MASSDRKVLTYHVAPRFDITAPKDPYDTSKNSPPLNLGTIVTSLSYLTPLNRKSRIISTNGVKLSDLVYPPVKHTNFVDTLAKVRAANLSAWVKALQAVNAGVDLSTERTIEETVECDSITTTYFDPTPEYVRLSLAVKEVQVYLEGSGSRATDLYMITGLKVAQNLRFKRAEGKSKQGGAHAEVDAGAAASAVVGAPPVIEGVGAGADVHAQGEETRETEHAVENDIVVGFRVNKYRCRRGLISKKWSTRDEGLVDGEMMGQDDSDDDDEFDEDDGPGARSGVFVTEFKIVEIPEEVAALKGQSAYVGKDEAWVLGTVPASV